MEKLRIEGLCKKYENFELKYISLSIPNGCCFGLIGENGAGKSTLIKSILGLVKGDEGKIYFEGREIEKLDKTERQKISFVLDDTGLPLELNLKMINRALSLILVKWEGDKFKELTEKFKLPDNLKLARFSKGMKMKAAIAIALSYDSDLLILDEPTSGLDPVSRDDILDLLYDYNKNADKAILFSSHITSDLEKLCDYIIYLNRGEIVLNEEKDELLRKYAVYSVEQRQLTELNKGAVLKVIKRDFGTDILALKEEMSAGFEYRNVSLEDFMLFFSKGEDLC